MGKTTAGKPTGSADELNIEDLDEELELEEEEEEGGEEGEDRGDVVNPEETAENLAAVAGEEEEDGEPAAGGKRSAVIPHARFNEVNEDLKLTRRRLLDLEEENARLKGTTAAAAGTGGAAAAEAKTPAFDVDAKEEEYADALMEGDKTRALAIRRAINAELRRQADEAANARTEEIVAQREVEREFKKVAAECMNDYPFLDVKSKDANAEAIEEVVALRNHYIERKGMSPAQALRTAADRIGKQYAKAKAKDDGAQDGEEGDEGGQPASGKTTSMVDRLKDRRAAGIRRNAATAIAQPASLAAAGSGQRGGSTASEVNVETMSEEDFERLPASEKKKLRGD